jgi:hypothetical protein
MNQQRQSDWAGMVVAWNREWYLQVVNEEINDPQKLIDSKDVRLLKKSHQMLDSKCRARHNKFMSRAKTSLRSASDAMQLRLGCMVHTCPAARAKWAAATFTVTTTTTTAATVTRATSTTAATAIIPAVSAAAAAAAAATSTSFTALTKWAASAAVAEYSTLQCWVTSKPSASLLQVHLDLQGLDRTMPASYVRTLQKQLYRWLDMTVLTSKAKPGLDDLVPTHQRRIALWPTSF